MKNILFSLCMSAPINVPDLFFRTMIDAAQNPHTLKPYALWIMKLIRAKTGFNYMANQKNHRVYVPPVEILPRTIASVAASDKGKGLFYEQFHPTKSLASRIHYPQSRTTEQTGTNASSEDTTQARVMNDRELLISLH